MDFANQRMGIWGLAAVATLMALPVQAFSTSTDPLGAPADPLSNPTISVGFDQVCAVSASGSALCWGGNGAGQLGDGTEVSLRLEPAPVSGSFSFRAVSAGLRRSCGLVEEGTLYCWGTQRLGGLGDAGTADRREPVQVGGDHRYLTVSVGNRHSCAVTDANVAHCWGTNAFGQLGDGSRVHRPEPTPVAGDLRFSSVSAGLEHSCGLTLTGEAWCWGANYMGQVGDGGRTDAQPAPVQVEVEGATFRSVAAGYNVGCGVTTSGEAWCWGVNHTGVLGDGSTELRAGAVKVEGGPRFQSVTVGQLHACGLAEDGSAWCWGLNNRGQLGDGSRNSRSAPIQVAGGHSFAALSAGALLTCGITVSGEGLCWGRDLSVGLAGETGGDALQPVRVETDSAFKTP